VSLKFVKLLSITEPDSKISYAYKHVFFEIELARMQFLFSLILAQLFVDVFRPGEDSEMTFLSSSQAAAYSTSLLTTKR